MLAEGGTAGEDGRQTWGVLREQEKGVCGERGDPAKKPEEEEELEKLRR